MSSASVLNENENVTGIFEMPYKFTQQLESLRQQLPAVLDDFNKYYVFYNKNPNYNEYQQIFEKIKNNLNSINSQMFMLSNHVENNIDKINAVLLDLNNSIEKFKGKNNKIIKQLNGIKAKHNAAGEMISNYKQVYDAGYLRNWALLLSIFIAGGCISKVYSNKLTN